jgi:eukaryotic-like serine/threonine-protein kinase
MRDSISLDPALLETEEHLTSLGGTVGTVAYMSPEQVRGKELDARTDLFSFGAVLYEMLTATMPFRGETAGVIVSEILDRSHVPASLLNPAVTPKLEDIINKCLEKDRRVRYQHASELRADLYRLKRDTENRNTVPQINIRARSNLLLRMSGVALALIVAAVLWHYLPLGTHFASGINTIAVLPFHIDSSDSQTEYLSDGITEGLIHSLSQLHELHVMAHSSTFRYKGRDVDAQQVGRELKVQALVVGTVRRIGNSVQIDTELVDINNGAELWGHTFTQTESEIRVT